MGINTSTIWHAGYRLRTSGLEFTLGFLFLGLFKEGEEEGPQKHCSGGSWQNLIAEYWANGAVLGLYSSWGLNMVLTQASTPSHWAFSSAPKASFLYHSWCVHYTLWVWTNLADYFLFLWLLLFVCLLVGDTLLCLRLTIGSVLTHHSCWDLGTIWDARVSFRWDKCPTCSTKPLSSFTTLKYLCSFHLYSLHSTIWQHNLLLLSWFLPFPESCHRVGITRNMSPLN